MWITKLHIHITLLLLLISICSGCFWSNRWCKESCTQVSCFCICFCLLLCTKVVLKRYYQIDYQVDCLALICVNHAFLRMVRKYELITHFPVVYADLRAVRKIAMILVWCPACTPVRLHHSPWAGVSLGFLFRKKTCDHCSSPRLLLSTNRVIKCRYLVNHTGIYLYIWGSVLAQLFYVLCSVITCLLTSWWTNIIRRLIQVQFSYLIYWFSHKLHGIFVIHTVSSFKTIFCVFWYLNR